MLFFWKRNFVLKIICYITFVDCRREILAKKLHGTLDEPSLFVPCGQERVPVLVNLCKVVDKRRGLMLSNEMFLYAQFFACKKKPSFIAQFLCRLHQKGAMSKSLEFEDETPLV